MIGYGRGYCSVLVLLPHLAIVYFDEVRTKCGVGADRGRRSIYRVVSYILRFYFTFSLNDPNSAHPSCIQSHRLRVSYETLPS